MSFLPLGNKYNCQFKKRRQLSKNTQRSFAYLIISDDAYRICLKRNSENLNYFNMCSFLLYQQDTRGRRLYIATQGKLCIIG